MLNDFARTLKNLVSKTTCLRSKPMLARFTVQSSSLLSKVALGLSFGFIFTSSDNINGEIAQYSVNLMANIQKSLLA